MKEYKNLTIKEWASEDRPREKLLKKGIFSLSDAELLAILLSTGTKNLTAVELAKQVLNSADNNLDKLGKLSINDLKKINGIGEAKAISILAALELGKRRKSSENKQQIISSSKQAFEHFHHLLSDLPHEEFWVLYLNRRNGIISEERISSGGISGTVIDVRIILKHGIEKLASGIILVHNHPSGNLNPSSEDKRITQKIKTGALSVDILVHDHIIIGNNSYYSFADKGLLNST